MPEYGGANSLGTTIEPTEIASGSYLVSTLDADVTGGTHSGDQTETTLATLTIPANKVVSSVMVIVDAVLAVTNAAAGDTTNSLKLYAGLTGAEALKATRTMGTSTAQTSRLGYVFLFNVTGLDWAQENTILIKGTLTANTVTAAGSITVNSAMGVGL